jgi:hypothetical protein
MHASPNPPLLRGERSCHASPGRLCTWREQHGFEFQCTPTPHGPFRSLHAADSAYTARQPPKHLESPSVPNSCRSCRSAGCRFARFCAIAAGAPPSPPFCRLGVEAWDGARRSDIVTISTYTRSRVHALHAARTCIASHLTLARGPHIRRLHVLVTIPAIFRVPAMRNEPVMTSKRSRRLPATLLP